MDSSFAISSSALNATQIRQRVVAHNVANINTDGYSERSVVQSESVTGGTYISSINKNENEPISPSNTDFATQSVEMVNNKNVYGANAKVFKVQNRMVGELLDLVG